MHTWPRSVWVVTVVALVNCMAVLLPAPHWVLAILFTTGPLGVLWMVWRVLTDDRMVVRELEAGEQWGYQDRPDLRPVE